MSFPKPENDQELETMLTETLFQSEPSATVSAIALRTVSGVGRRSREYSGSILPKRPVVEAICQSTINSNSPAPPWIYRLFITS